ncbi:hypothetical protein CW304_19000 [Bacillus sp. UFRGS-B20]|nr:hypothetical protein CW304_19000 [Bacillus sp. UFRGS-B20]
MFYFFIRYVKFYKHCVICMILTDLYPFLREYLLHPSFSYPYLFVWTLFVFKTQCIRRFLLFRYRESDSFRFSHLRLINWTYCPFIR